MASKIQGITVEIGGDTTKLSATLSGVNKEIKSTQTQLNDVEKLLKLNLMLSQMAVIVVRNSSLVFQRVKNAANSVPMTATTTMTRAEMPPSAAHLRGELGYAFC